MTSQRHVFTLLAAACGISATAQQSSFFNSPEAEFENALQLYEASMYGAARNAFHSFIENWRDVNGSSVLLEDARYFEALSAKLAANADASRLLDDFQHYDRHNAHCADAYYHAGDAELLKGDISQALCWLEKSDERAVSSENRVPLLFKRGYCYFMSGKHHLAIAQFDKFKGEEGEFESAVMYYRAHVLYENGNYDTALKLFLELEQDDGFSTAASYYIAQIMYIKGHYAEAIRYASPFAKASGSDEKGAKSSVSAQSSDKVVEMTRIVADSHFMLGEYAAALSSYSALSELLKSNLTRADYYHVGLSYSKTGNYSDAAANLSKVTSGNDALAQNAYYNLAICCLEIGDKKRARTAFDAASRQNYDKAVAEDAHFNKLKLAYELNFSPFNDLVTQLLDFLKLYPNTLHRDEAYSLIGKALVSTKNYEQAFETMEKVEHKDFSLCSALQRIAFSHAMELYSDGDTDGASQFLENSLRYGDYDPKLKARAYFWQGECLYSGGKVSEARDKYLTFINAYQAAEVPEFYTAHYDVAYTYFNTKDYANARRWFIKFVSVGSSAADPVQMADAYNRLGDCLYVERDFKGAIKYYSDAACKSAAKADYSLLQEGICLGLLGDYQAKLAKLSDVISKYPKSVYVDNAYFETARAYVALGQIKEAIYNYKIVKERYPKGSLASQAMLQLGLLYYNNNEFDNSMAFYKRVINEYPSTPEAADALAGLRNVYMERGDYDGYIAYTSTLGSFAHVGEAERDSLLFVSASNLQFNMNQPDEAKAAYKRYLETSPSGRNITPASYFLGNIYYAESQFDDALPLYQFVASQPRSVFTEDALLRSGELLYKSDKFADALETFKRLEAEAEVEANKAEAVIGEMRCMSKQGDLEQCVAGADKVIAMSYVDPAILREAQYLKAKSLLAMSRAAEAVPVLRSLSESTKTSEGAESKYLLAQYYYDGGDFEKAEAEVLDYVEKGTPHQYWLAKSFVLLSDVYHAKGDDFQAVQYLLTLKESYSADDDIASEIESRLSKWNAQADEPANN